MMIGKQFPQIDIHHSDCVEGMKELDDASIDVVVTSPPYNLGINYNSYKDDKKWEDYFKEFLEWTDQVHRTLKHDGSFFLNIAGSPRSPLMPHRILSLLCDENRERHFVLQNEIHWVKSVAVPKKKVASSKNQEGKCADDDDNEEVTIGHIKPINSGRFINDSHEFVFHLTPKGDNKLDRLSVGVPYADKSNIGRWKHTDGADLKCRGNVWFIPYKTIQNRLKDRPHPATFPTELAVKCIKLHGKNGSSVVMDPFLGIGHAAFAAIECGVAKFIGFDIDADYLNVARSEIAKLKG